MNKLVKLMSEEDPMIWIHIPFLGWQQFKFACFFVNIGNVFMFVKKMAKKVLPAKILKAVLLFLCENLCKIKICAL